MHQSGIGSNEYLFYKLWLFLLVIESRIFFELLGKLESPSSRLCKKSKSPISKKNWVDKYNGEHSSIEVYWP